MTAGHADGAAPPPLDAPLSGVASGDPTATEGERPASRRGKMRVPIARLLVVGFGLLTLIAVSSVLALGLIAAGRSTLALLRDKTALAVEAVTERVQLQLDPMMEDAAAIAGLIRDGTFGRDDPETFVSTMGGVFVARPQLWGFAYTEPDQWAVRVGRFDDQVMSYAGDLATLAEDHPTAAADIRSLPRRLEEARHRPAPYWVDPRWERSLGHALAVAVAPVIQDGELRGLVEVGVSLAVLSEFLDELYIETGVEAALLLDNRYVVAHPSLNRQEHALVVSRRNPPLPTVPEIGDEVLMALWDEDAAEIAVQPRREGGPFDGRETVHLTDRDVIVVVDNLPSYGSRHWTISLALPAATPAIRELTMTATVGLSILFVSVIAALIAGKVIARRITRLADAARHLGTLDLATAGSVPDSRIREISDAATAFNTMTACLRWFEAYVPKALVLQLMRRGGSLPRSEERAATVMFTDIVGFSHVAERLGAAETAELLNRHFHLVAHAIEAEGGTVDKFIGDGVMTFWGAPDPQPDHAARALRAACAIADAVAEDNKTRASLGDSSLRLRIGMHSGPVVVGNIGSASRMNYTIVGETVNVAARLEELGKEFDDGTADTIIIASADTMSTSGRDFAAVSLGRVELRGHSDVIEAFRVHARHKNGDAEFHGTAETARGAG